MEFREQRPARTARLTPADSAVLRSQPRSVTAPVAVLAPTPQPRATEAKQRNMKPRFSRKSVVITGLIAVIVLAIGTFSAHIIKPANTIPAYILKSTSVTLYYPSKLPAGYTIAKSSFAQSADVVTYYAQNKQGNRIFFSIQPVPDKTETDDFNTRALQNKVNVLSDVGTAAVGTFNNRTVGSLMTKKSWVLITTTDRTSQTAVAALLTSMK